jgi:glycine/D-amino acid oxidase-like deaminating enzyme/nitrite reductase/ring-hydroxylating ferredoxin subunit
MPPAPTCSRVGSGETGRTTAHLVNVLDDRYGEIERLHGERGAQFAAESHTQAIDQIEQMIAEEGISCAFERLAGYLFVPPGEDVSLLARELEAAHRAGLRHVELVNRSPLPDFDTGPCLRFPHQAQFHPLQYLAGVAAALGRLGGRLYTQTRALQIEGGDDARIQTVRGPVVSARHVVVATNTPVQNMVTMHTKQAAYRTYVIGLEVPQESVPKALYWDTADPYHYVRLQRRSREAEILLVGGEDHKTGQDEEDGIARFARLEAWARERFPRAEYLAYQWSGQIMEPVDSLAFIGRNPGDHNHIYLVTGDSGHGMTHGTIAGMLLRDMILGVENPWKALYDPARRTLRAAGAFLRENLNVAAQYTEWVTAGELRSAEELAPGGGGVMRDGVKKIALYRDDQGTVHAFSALCPHLGCVVAWNAAEKTWDCPCHGSRFNARGEVVHGPARQGLDSLN